MARFKPKSWLRPRSRRHREHHAGHVSATDILKDIWNDGWVRPAWAKLAHSRGWMTGADYYRVEPEDTGQRISELLYEDNMFFKMTPKDRA